MKPGAIAVVDIGATNTRVVLMDENLREIQARKEKTNHLDGPLYKSIDERALLLGVDEAREARHLGRVALDDLSVGLHQRLVEVVLVDDHGGAVR